MRMNGDYMMTEFGKAHLNNDGYYVIVNNGENHMKYLHRLIYEKTHKLTLLSSAIIHHEDGNRSNNSIENLKMMSRAEHNSIHHKDKINSPETIKKMSQSKMMENNPMFGKGECEYYRVYKTKCSNCKQGFRWVYEYKENGKPKKVSRVNLTDLEVEIKSRGLDWFKINSDEVL